MIKNLFSNSPVRTFAGSVSSEPLRLLKAKEVENVLRFPLSCRSFYSVNVKLKRGSIFSSGRNNALKISYNYNNDSDRVFCRFCSSSQTMPTEATTKLMRKVLKTKEDNKKIIAKLLGTDPTAIKRVPGVRIIDEVKGRRSLEKLLKFGFTKGSVQLYPELLLKPHGALENYVRMMHEMSFTSISEDHILRFRVILRQTLPCLQENGILPEISTVVKSMCDAFEEGEEIYKRVLDTLPEDTQKVTLLELRNHIIASHFDRISPGAADDIMRGFKTYRQFNFRCINWIKRNYETLKDFGFTDEKIRKHIYLLMTDPDNLSRLTTIPSLAGIEMKKLSQLRPKVLMSSYDTLMDIEKAFIEHSIPFESVQKYLNLLTLSSSTIRQRLQEIESTPEFAILKLHPQISRLLYFLNTAKERLKEFQKHNTVPSINMLAQNPKRFEKLVSSRDPKVRGVDAVICIAEMLHVHRNVVRTSLRRHPHWMHAHLVTMEESLIYLQNFGSIPTKHIIKALPIILYSQKQIEHGVEAVLASGEAAPTDPYFLEMVLYFIEKPTHFTGDGIWSDRPVKLFGDVGHESHVDDGDDENDDDDDDDSPRREPGLKDSSNFKSMVT